MVAEKDNAVCSICGNPYHKCLSCRDSMKLQPWKMFTDTAEHYKVFQAVKGFSTGIYDKDEFKSKLKNIDLSDLENYKENIKVLIKNVLKEKTIKNTVKIDEAVEDVIKIEPVEVKEEAVEKSISRKRNYKANNEVEEME